MSMWQVLIYITIFYSLNIRQEESNSQTAPNCADSNKNNKLSIEGPHDLAPVLPSRVTYVLIQTLHPARQVCRL
jgi:hypothetical protein